MDISKPNKLLITLYQAERGILKGLSRCGEEENTRTYVATVNDMNGEMFENLHWGWRDLIQSGNMLEKLGQ